MHILKSTNLVAVISRYSKKYSKVQVQVHNDVSTRSRKTSQRIPTFSHLKVGDAAPFLCRRRFFEPEKMALDVGKVTKISTPGACW